MGEKWGDRGGIGETEFGCAMMTGREGAADMMRFPRRFLPLLCTLLFALLLARSQANAQAQSSSQIAASAAMPSRWNDAVNKLAAEIAAAAKPATAIVLKLENQSPISEAQAAAVREGLASQLRQSNLSVRFAPAAASNPPANPPAGADTANVRVVLSQGADGLLWIAQVERADSRQVAIVPVPQAAAPALPGRIPVLQRRIVYQGREPILDFTVNRQGNVDSWRVLGDGGLAEFTAPLSAGADSIPITRKPLRNAPASRDPRGRLAINAAGYPAILLGNTSCAESPGESSLFCGGQAAAEWPIGGGWRATYDGDHNYFQATSLTSDISSWKLPAFFSAATFEPAQGAAEIILSELDGKARLYSRGTDAPKSVFSGWGDEVATLPANCDQDWHVLAAGTGDWTQPDFVQMYRVENGQASAEGERLNLPGPVLSIWRAPGESSVRMISRNLETGMYEASVLSASCGN